MIKLPPCGMDLVILITIITIKQPFLQNYVINKVISTWLPYFPCSFLKPISTLELGLISQSLTQNYCSINSPFLLHH